MPVNEQEVNINSSKLEGIVEEAFDQLVTTDPARSKAHAEAFAEVVRSTKGSLSALRLYQGEDPLRAMAIGIELGLVIAGQRLRGRG